MPQIDFFLCREDKMLLADLIFKSGARMIVEDNYDNQSFNTILSLDKYQEYVMNNVLMFILHPETLKHPLEWGSFEKEGKKSFSYDKNTEGQLLIFIHLE